MAKPARAREPEAMARELERLGVPVLGALEEPAYADGGDRFWLDDETMAIGLGYRTNLAGVEAVRALAAPEGVAVEAYDMPHDQGPGFVLHLQSFLSAVTGDLCVVYEPLAPVRLLQDLRARGFDWIAISHDDYLAMGCNVLAVRPGVVVMVDGVPGVRRALEARGVEVHVYDGSELSLKGDGGPDVPHRAAAAGRCLMPMFGYKASAEQFGPSELLGLQRTGRGLRGWRSSRCRITSSRGATMAATRRPRCRGSPRRASGPPARASGRACSRRRCATTRR